MFAGDGVAEGSGEDWVWVGLGRLVLGTGVSSGSTGCRVSKGVVVGSGKLGIVDGF